MILNWVAHVAKYTRTAATSSPNENAYLSIYPFQATSVEEEAGVTKKYDANYAVMFNIILWGSIILILSLYYISYGMWMMDPGKDSIIYRMTSQRMKKD